MIVLATESHIKNCFEDQVQSDKRCISVQCMHWRTLEGKANLTKFTGPQIELLRTMGFCGKSDTPELSSLCLAAEALLGIGIRIISGEFEPV